MTKAIPRILAYLLVVALLVGCGGGSHSTDARSKRDARGVRATLLGFTRAVDPKDIPGTCRALADYVTKDFLAMMEPLGGCQTVLSRLHGEKLFPTAAQVAKARVTVTGSTARYTVAQPGDVPTKGSMIYGSDHLWRMQAEDDAGNPVK